MDYGIIKKIFLVLCFFIALIAYANENDLKVYDEILEYYKSLDSYQANFEQNNYWPELDLGKTSIGRISYTKNKLMMKYDDPDGQMLYADSLGISIFDAQSNQVLLMDNSNVLKEMHPSNILQTYKENSTISISEENQKYSISIIPNDDNGVSIIYLEIDKETMLIKMMRYEDLDSNEVAYFFSGEVLNEEILQEALKFEYPEDATVIDQRY